MSFGEICEAAAVVVAKAVRGKADLEKLDLNGKIIQFCCHSIVLLHKYALPNPLLVQNSFMNYTVLKHSAKMIKIRLKNQES